MIIGFSGRKGSGKSFFSSYLVKTYGFKELSFAGPLKKGLKHIFNLTEEQLTDPIKKEEFIPRLNASPRQLMQWMGTDVIREEFNNKFSYRGSVWVDNVREQIRRLRKENRDVNIVISDVRFMNEVDMIHELGGIIVNVITPRELLEYGPNDRHKSEMQELDFDHRLINDKTNRTTKDNYLSLDNICYIR